MNCEASIVFYETLTIVFHVFVHGQIPFTFTGNYSILFCASIYASLSGITWSCYRLFCRMTAFV